MRSIPGVRIAGIVLVVMVVFAHAAPSMTAMAAAPTHTPTATATAIPTQTPYPTNTPAATYTPYPSPTAAPSPSPSPSPYPQGPGPNGTYCTGGLLNSCLDFGGILGAIFGAVGKILNDAVVAIFSPVEHAFSNAFATLTSPFTHALTYTPDVTNEDSWAGLRTFQTTLQGLAGVLFVGFLTIGVFGAYLGSIGVGDFAQLTSPIRRAVLVTGFIAGYKQIMGTGFTVLNATTGVITDAPLSHNESAWTALSGAMATLHNVVGLTGVIDVLVLVAGLALSLLCVIVRMMGLGLLAALYVVGPLALVTWLSPQFDFIARWWVKTFVSLALWPLGYSVALKVIQIMLAGHGPLSEFNGMASALGALGLLIGLYRVPTIIGSMVGAGGALVAGAAASVTDAGVAGAVSLATRGIAKRAGL